MKSLRAPFWLFAVPAAIIAAMPTTWSDALLLRPEALAHGELWRLWTGHWVHFSTSHLAWNLAVLLVVGTRLEVLRPGWVLRYSLVAAPAISIAILALEPSLKAYGGLSGLAAGLVVLLAVRLIRTREDVPLGLGLLAILGLKVLTETQLPGSLFAQFESPSILPSPAAHLAGALVTLLLHGWLVAGPKFFPPCQPTQTLRSLS